MVNNIRLSGGFLVPTLTALLTLPSARWALAEGRDDAKDAEEQFPPWGFLGRKEFILSVLVIGLCGFMTYAALRLSREGRMSADDVIRLIAVLLIVSGVLLLVAAGSTAQAISPALGLLGTIAGYLLGRADRRTPSSPQHAPVSDD
jgi:heme/copper-type cytochrome/quinol oxidase subunit 3